MYIVVPKIRFHGPLHMASTVNISLAVASK
jgi:hypothetical protein